MGEKQFWVVGVGGERLSLNSQHKTSSISIAFYERGINRLENTGTKQEREAPIVSIHSSGLQVQSRLLVFYGRKPNWPGYPNASL